MPKLDFIINPISGGRSKAGFESWISSCPSLDSAQCNLLYTKRKGDAAALAEASKADAVVAVGGDGTVNEVASALVRKEAAERLPALGIVPFGSGDGLARHLKLPRKPRKALGVIGKGRELLMDSGVINGQPFFCTCGLGFDAAVAWAFARSGKRGLFQYIKQGLRLWKSYKALDYELLLDGRPLRRKAFLITFANANQWGNNSFIAPMASVCDGLLDITLLRPFPAWKLPLVALRLMTGRLHRQKEVEAFRVRSALVKAAGETVIHYDGEPSLVSGNISVEVRPASLRVIVP